MKLYFINGGGSWGIAAVIAETKERAIELLRTQMAPISVFDGDIEELELDVEGVVFATEIDFFIGM